MTYNKHLFKNLAYDPETQIAPVTNLFFMTQALVINSKLNVKSVDELVAHAKANPKTLNYTAPAAALVLFIENLNRQHGIDIVRVPFRSGGERVNGVLSGVSPITFIGIGNMMPHLRAGTITGLIVDGDKRTPLLPGRAGDHRDRLQGAADALLFRALCAGRHGEGADGQDRRRRCARSRAIRRSARAT